VTSSDKHLSPGLQRVMVTSASSILAVVVAFAISAVVLLITGKDPVAAYSTLFSKGFTADGLQGTVQRATPLMISGAAVAVGFKMNLFNIGVEGQFRVALLTTAVLGAAVQLPAPLHVLFCLVVAMASGALWAGIAGYLKVFRGVNEVISTIMLNFIALSLVAWAFDTFFRVESESQSLLVKTKDMPSSSFFPDIVKGQLNGFIVVAVVMLITFWVVVWKTKFGTRLRASGVNPGAARVSGVDPRKMTMMAMVLSGAVAGLVGMRHLLGEAHAYNNGLADGGLGFDGIAVALLGRNHPAGIAISALLFGFLDEASNKLQLEGVPKEIVTIMKGIIVFAVVIINEAVKRWDDKRIQNRAAELLERPVVVGASL
jgi:general nucleoside transport system permease protein